MKITSLFLASILALPIGMISLIVEADDDFSRSEIRQLVNEGRILSLESILNLYPEQEHGDLLDLEVEKEHGKIVYELEFLLDNGRVLEMEIDARNGQLLKKEFE